MKCEKFDSRSAALKDLMREIVDSGLLDDVMPEAEGMAPEMAEEEMEDGEEEGPEGEMMPKAEPKKVRVSITQLAGLGRGREGMKRKGSGKRG